MLDLYGKVFRNVLLPAWESGVRRRPTLDVLSYLEKTEWRSRDELDALQAGALQRLVRHAYECVPFYRARFDSAGLHPSAIRSAADLATLPSFARDDARRAGDSRKSTAAPFATITKHTGGTTGEPLRFGYDLASEHFRNAVKLRGYGWAGYRLGDKVLHFWGAPIEGTVPIVTRAKTALDRHMKREHYIPCGSITDSVVDQVVRFLREERPRVMICYTQAGAELARVIRRRGLRDWPDMIVICGAEKLFPYDRAELEGAFGPAVFETYGSREAMLLGAECSAHDGLHTSHENIVFEIVVKDANGVERQAAPGEVGDILITDLHNFGMPFIRYRVGDTGAWAKAPADGRCSCGRALPRLASVNGRASDMIVAKDGTYVNGIAFNVLFTKLAPVVRKFQVVQKKDRSVILKLVPDAGYEPVHAAEIARTCARYLGGLPVTVELASSIESTHAGKHRTVIIEK